MRRVILREREEDVFQIIGVDSFLLKAIEQYGEFGAGNRVIWLETTIFVALDDLEVGKIFDRLLCPSGDLLEIGEVIKASREGELTDGKKRKN